MRAAALIICAFLACNNLAAWTPEKWFEAPRSSRAVHYDIKGVLDWPKKMFEGQMVLTWRNSGTSPVQDLPFHLYLNAFRNSDTPFMKTAWSKNVKMSEAAWGYCEIKSAFSNGTELSRRISEDDTVHWFGLPAPVKPGEVVRVEIAWEAKFPEIHFGSGWTGRYLVASMWYPKIGTYTGSQWVCRPFSGDAAFQGNFGIYDVELSLPNALQLANTGTVVTPLEESGQPLTDRLGRLVEAKQDPDRKLNFIYKIHAEDVQDFSWIVAPAKTWRLVRLDIHDAHVFFYHIPKNGSQANRLKETIRQALRYAESRIGSYPYPILSIVDLPPEAHSAIPSPTLALLSNIAFDPLNQRIVPEKAALQQLGWQLFKGPLASNPLDRHLLEAGLANWFADINLEGAFGGLITSKRFIMGTTFFDRYEKWPFLFGCLNRAAVLLPPFFSADNNNDQSSVLPLRQLDALLGRDALESVIRAYYTEMSFKYPSHDDFRQIAERVSGQGLSIFWENHMKGGTLDYRIKHVVRTTDGNGAITLERLGNIAVPITLWTRLENGLEIRQIWDGEEMQVTFSFNSPISAAELDPDRAYPNLKSRLHTTYSAKPIRRGLHYWAQNIFGAIGGLLQGIGLGSLTSTTSFCNYLA